MEMCWTTSASLLLMESWIRYVVMFSCVRRAMTVSLAQVGERIYPLDQVELAFKSLAAGGHKGKLVVRMAPEPEPEPGALVFRG